MDNWDQIITQRASQQTLAAFLAPLDLGTDLGTEARFLRPHR